MGLLIRLVELLILVVPLIGVLFAGLRAYTAFRDRQATAETEAIAAPAPPQTSTARAAKWRAITRTVKVHDRTDTRWLEYELDISKLLDYPLMTDMRNPLTERFHRAKLRAELLRPAKAEDLLEGGDAAREYLDAVEEYVTAFDVAEAEAIRRGRKDFTRDEQQRLARALSALRVAADNAATLNERERAYDLARKELDGLIVLPERARASIERSIAGELDS